MKKFLLLSGLASAALLAACSQSTTTGNTLPTDVPADTSSSVAIVDDTASSEAADKPVDVSDARIIEVSAKDWEFSPNAITASVGEKVVIRVTGVEGEHSFAIADLGINVPVAAGETKDIPLPTATPGTFEFRCRIPCGPGHKDMTGTIVIN